MRDTGIEVRPAQHYTQHGAGIYQGAKPAKLKGVAHASQSVHRVSASLQARMYDSGASHDEPSILLALQVGGVSTVVWSLPCIVAFRDAHGPKLKFACSQSLQQ